MKKLEKCKVELIVYEHSDTIEKQGTRDSISKYLKNGYYIKEDRNGYWVLVKPSKVMVTLKSSIGTQTSNLKEDILDFYGKRRISKKQTDKFAKDIDDGKVFVFLSESGIYCLKKSA